MVGSAHRSARMLGSTSRNTVSKGTPGIALSLFSKRYRMSDLHGFRSAKTLCWAGLGLIAAGLAACGGGGGGDSTPQQGTLKLAMTDAPACGYDHVYVTVSKIRVHQSATAGATDSGWSELAIPARRIDLLSLTNGVLQELGSLPLPAGKYQQIRLVLADNPSNPTSVNPLANALVLSGSTNEIALTTPGSQQSGFKLKANFNVTGGQVADMVLDFVPASPLSRQVTRATTTSNPWWPSSSG